MAQKLSQFVQAGIDGDAKTLRQPLRNEVKARYVLLVTEYVPGPLSLSYFAPFILLPLALLIDPEWLSHKQLRNLLLPIIYAAVFHAWYSMRGLDVISVDGLLWSTLLIGFKDVRKDFKRLLIMGPDPDYSHRQNSSRALSKHLEHRQDVAADAKGINIKHPDKVEMSDSALHGPLDAYGFMRTSEPRVVEQPYPQSFWARLNWVGNLLASIRLHAWTTGSPSRDQRQIRNLRCTPTRLRFTLSLIPNLILVQGMLLPLLFQLALFDPAITSIQPLQTQTLWPLFSE